MIAANDKACAASRRQRREQDAARFAEVFLALTGFRPASAYREALPREFLAQSIPSPDELVARFGDRFQLRTSNALRRYVAGSVERVGWTYGRLLDLRGFGIFSLLDVMQALHDSAP
jgi:hypothetical protein